MLYTFKLKDHSYQLDQFISVLRASVWYFHFYSNINRTFSYCRQMVDTIFRLFAASNAASEQVLNVFPESHKRMLGLYGFKHI